MIVPRQIFAIAKMADAESSRYALGGIQLSREINPDGSPGAPVAVACDGLRLLAVTWPEAAPGEFPAIAGTSQQQRADFSAIIPVKTCDKAKRLLGVKVTNGQAEKKPVLTNVLIDESTPNTTPGDVPADVTIHATNLEDTCSARVRPLEGRYPRWRDVIPARGGKDSISIAVNPRLLGELLIAMADAGFEADGSDDYASPGCVVLNIAGDDKPLTISAKTRDGMKAVGIVMPLHNHRHPTKPHWIAAGYEGAEVEAESVELSPEPEVLKSEMVEEVAEAVAAEEKENPNPSPIQPQPRRKTSPRIPRRRNAINQPEPVMASGGDSYSYSDADSDSDDSGHSWARSAASMVF